MSDKIDGIFKKVKHFDMLKHSKFSYNDDIPDNLIEHAADFEFYFNSKNKSKRIFLNSEEILDQEKQLSKLLERLIHFHNTFFMKNEPLTTEMVLDLQEIVRENIESLLMLGISCSCDFTARDKIVLVGK